jgi:hypothetical protein
MPHGAHIGWHLGKSALSRLSQRKTNARDKLPNRPSSLHFTAVQDLMRGVLRAVAKWLRLIGLPMAGLPMFVVWSANAQPLPAQPTLRHSEAGHFIVRVSGIQHPEHLNRMHGLELSLSTADGKPAAGATIVLTGQRRYSSNPLPTLPAVTPEPAAGHYQVAGLRFHMPGEWRLVLDIDFAHIRDRATLDVVVK